MNVTAPDPDSKSSGRQLARLSIAAAFLSCTANCLFSQLASRAESQLVGLGWMVDWASLAVVLAGVVLGAIALVGGRRRKSSDTAAIAAIGLVLNLGILFVVVWYFAIIRPAATGTS